MLVGYVYVDVTSERDLGSYVEGARRAVDAAIASGRVVLPEGGRVRWTGQYELLKQMEQRMKVLVPLALLCVVLLLYLQFKNLTEVLIVLLSLPFALVGSAWLLFLLGYHLSTAVWVGVIALVGLAAQTGVIMIVYIDHAYEKRLAEGRINSLEDIIAAHAEGTVKRVRPKLMTVGTMLLGLVPLLWATGSGADVMKRIAAPMVGGLVTSAFLTLEIIPVIYTYWRNEQLVRRRVSEVSSALERELSSFVLVIAGGAGLGVLAIAVWLYVPGRESFLFPGVITGLVAVLLGSVGYVWARTRALHLISGASGLPPGPALPLSSDAR
jgi:Cu(I)/Ag(I) efflux system membrane protein CusA/SilA